MTMDWKKMNQRQVDWAHEALADIQMRKDEGFIDDPWWRLIWKKSRGEEPTGLAGELDTLAPRFPSSWPLFTLAIAVATDSQKSNCLSSLTHPLPSVLSASPQEPTWHSCVQSTDMRELRGKVDNKGWNQWVNSPLVLSPSRKNLGQILYCPQRVLAGLSLGFQRSDQREDIPFYWPSLYWLAFPVPFSSTSWLFSYPSPKPLPQALLAGGQQAKLVAIAHGLGGQEKKAGGMTPEFLAWVTEQMGVSITH